ncbi:hypothetical protein FQZ97_933090 [compost metagenome]
MSFQLAVVTAHLLQADDVGVELLHRVGQVVDLQPARRPQALHAFVDVVGGHTQDAHARNDRMLARPGVQVLRVRTRFPG